MTFIVGARLPIGIERGVTGGSLFDTEVLLLDSGREFRNINWQDARGKWDAGFGVRRVAEDPLADLDTTVHELQAFFHVMRGKAHSFRFKDDKNFNIGDPLDAQNDHQNIGLGDDTTTVFQAFVGFSIPGVVEVYNKPITKFVSGTVSVFIDSLLQGAGFTIQEDAGTITFSVAPAGGEVIAIAAEFDHHVRFDTDHLNMSLEHLDLGSWPSIPLIELLEAS